MPLSTTDLVLYTQRAWVPTGKRGLLASDTEAAELACGIAGFVLANFDPLVLSDSARSEPVTPDERTFKPKKTRVPWQEALASMVAELLGCRVDRDATARGNALLVSGPVTLVSVAQLLISSALTATETYADKTYLRLFYAALGTDRLGDVTPVRGERERILDRVLAAFTGPALEAYRRNVDPGLLTTLANYRGLMDPATSGHPVRDARAPSPPDPEQEARVAALTEAARLAGQEDERLDNVYSQALEHAGLSRVTLAEGVAYDLRPKKFSVTAALERADVRLGQPATRFCIRNSVLYLSAPEAVLPSIDAGRQERWTRVATTVGSPS